MKIFVDEIGVPPAPYLVADTLTATSLSLAWERVRYSEISYLVQWRYEEHAGAWQYCRNQSWGSSNVLLVENLQPYTKYRVGLLRIFKKIFFLEKLKLKKIIF